MPAWKRESLARSAASAAVVAAKTAPAVVAAETRVRYCRFEDHRYNNETREWSLSKEALRMCPNADCKFKHRIDRPAACLGNQQCSDYSCRLLHSTNRPKPCRFGVNCLNDHCIFAHPVNRAEPCPQAGNCYDHAIGNGHCALNHPRRMGRVCRHDRTCRNFECQYLHHTEAPIPCPDGGACQYQDGSNLDREQHNACLHKHPRYEREVLDSRGQRHFM